MSQVQRERNSFMNIIPPSWVIRYFGQNLVDAVTSGQVSQDRIKVNVPLRTQRSVAKHR